MLEVLYGSGLRVSELVSLPLSALHLMEGWMKVRGKRGHERVVPMGEPKIAALQAYLRKPRAMLLGQGQTSIYVFVAWRGNPMTRQGFWKRLMGYAKQAGIVQPMSPHTLRHTFATHLLQGGADIPSIAHWLRHRDVSTTEIYTRLHTEYVWEIYDRYHPRA